MPHNEPEEACSHSIRTYKCLKIGDQNYMKLYRARAFRLGLASEIAMKRMHHESEMLTYIGIHPNIVSLH